MNNVQGLESITPINALPVGTQLNEYVIRSVVGEGGFGIVYLADDTLLEREVAIKEYLPASLATRSNGVQVSARISDKRELFEKGLQRFVKEAHILAKFQHPALVSVLRFFSANGTAYMVMPYYRGKTLRDMIRSGYRVKDTKSLLSILLPILTGLSQIHSVECYHLDVSSDNILILENDTPVLLDFGSARHEQVTDIQSATIILKPGFAPIEQYSDGSGQKLGPWTDIYAASAVTYQLVTGNIPVISVARIVQDTLKPLAGFATPELSAEVLGVIDTGLRVGPQARPQTIKEFITALRDAAKMALLFEGEFDTDAFTLLNKPNVHSPDGKLATLREKLAKHGALLMPAVRSRLDAAANATSGAAKWLGDKAVRGLGATKEWLNTAANATSVTAKWLGGKVAKGLVATKGRLSTAANVASGAAKRFLRGSESAVDSRWRPRIAAICMVFLLSFVVAIVSVAPWKAPKFVTDKREVAEVTTPVATPATVVDDIVATAPPAAPRSETPRSVSVEEPEPPPLPNKGGIVEVTVKPWGYVYLNGVKVGTAPPRVILENLADGTHLIEIRNESGAKHIQAVSVSKGQTVRVTHTFGRAN